jgi:hypothetical protein
MQTGGERVCPAAHLMGNFIRATKKFYVAQLNATLYIFVPQIKRFEFT